VLGLQGVGKDMPNGAFYDRVIPNFFRSEEFPIQEVKVDKKDRGINGEEYILYVGRLIPRKGINIAVRLAIETKTKLLMAGQGGITGVSPYVRLIGILDPVKRNYYMSRAKAVIVPTVYTEPFGGVAVEAMLSGAPILTTNFGVFPEYNLNGVTGYRCDLFRDFVNGLTQVDNLDRMVIRKHAERYLMDNIKWEYQKWFDELYHFYLGVDSKDSKIQENIWFEKF
jgi:glycosyltransferase involved in cell wall biosynthesis